RKGVRKGARLRRTPRRHERHRRSVQSACSAQSAFKVSDADLAAERRPADTTKPNYGDGAVTGTVPAGFGAFGVGKLTTIAVATSTKAAIISSARAERRILNAASSLPRVGRCLRQFHAPRANTAATRHSFTISA